MVGDLGGHRVGEKGRYMIKMFYIVWNSQGINMFLL